MINKTITKLYYHHYILSTSHLLFNLQSVFYYCQYLIHQFCSHLITIIIIFHLYNLLIANQYFKNKWFQRGVCYTQSWVRVSGEKPSICFSGESKWLSVYCFRVMEYNEEASRVWLFCATETTGNWRRVF